jgi:hypothetical protein
MAKRRTKKTVSEQTELFPKPRLIRVGKHLIDPNDVAAIVKAGEKKGLFIILLKSQPNAEYPMWVMESELGTLLEQFEIVEND